MAQQNGKTASMTTRVTLVEVSPETVSWLRENLSSNLTLSEMPGVEQLLTASSLGTLDTDVIVLGKELEEPISVCRRITENDRDLQVIIRAPEDDCARINKQIDHGGLLADQVTVCPLGEITELPEKIKRAVKRARRRCSYRRNPVADEATGETGAGSLPDVTHYLDSLLERAPIGMLTIDRNGSIQTLNRRARHLLGVSEAEVLKTPVGRFFDTEDRQRLEALIARCSSPDEPPERDTARRYFTLGGNTGEPRYVEISASAHATRSGQPGTMLILHDVTDRVAAERERVRATVALQLSEDRFLELAEVLQLIPWESDPDTGCFTFVGEQAEDILGYPTGDWYRPGFWHDVIHPDDRAWAVAFCEDNRRRLQNYDFEYRIMTADGNVRRVHDIVNVLRDDQGRATKLRGFMMDVTDRRPDHEAVGKPVAARSTPAPDR